MVSHLFFFKCLVDYIKGQWKLIRDNYRRCLQKRDLATRSGAGRSKLASCKFFTQLEFLHDSLSNKETDSNIRFDVEPSSSNVDNQESTNFLADELNESHSSEPPTKKQAKNDISASNSTNTSKNKKKGASVDNIDSILLKTISEMDHAVSCSKNNNDDDDTTLFCKSLINRLKSLPKKKNHKARMNIENMLFELEYEDE